MVRGEIYFADLLPRSGSEQKGRRPCIIVSHDAFNENTAWRSITVVPLTSSLRWLRASPTTVTFQVGECGLPKECAALARLPQLWSKNAVSEPFSQKTAKSCHYILWRPAGRRSRSGRSSPKRCSNMAWAFSGRTMQRTRTSRPSTSGKTTSVLWI